jgi:hypothetical protein
MKVNLSIGFYRKTIIGLEVGPPLNKFMENTDRKALHADTTTGLVEKIFC